MKLVIVVICLVPCILHAQFDTAFIMQLKSLDTANILKFDTVAVPEDPFTKKIKALHKQRRGLTAETIVRIKIMEDREKDTVRGKNYYDQLLAELTTGATGKLIENSFINTYRRTFTEKEVDELTRFYKTSAGKKMDREHFVMMVRSIKDLEQLMKLAYAKLDANKKNE